MEITFETKAWISEYNSVTPKELQTVAGVASLHYSRTDLSEHGYTLAGTAKVTIDVIDEHALIQNKVESLRQQAVTIRAEATAKCTRIEGMIQQLLCIEHSTADID